MPFDRDWSEDPPEALYLPNRRNMLKWLGVAGLGGLAGCSGGPGGTQTPRERTVVKTVEVTREETPTATPEARQLTEQFTEAFSSAASTLNWFYNVEASTGERIGLTLDGAWAVTTETEVFPLWLDYETDDGQTYTIHVRDGLEWGGAYGQMTAEDWVFMINELFQSDWAAYPSASDWTGVTVEETGKLTFDVTLPQVDPAWPLRPVLWGQNCAPKEIFQPYVEMAADGSPDQARTGLEEDTELNNLSYTGNLGAFTIDVWEEQSRFQGTRNENYYMGDRDDVPEAWQGAPWFEKWTMLVVPEQSSRLQALRNGETDTAAIPPERAQEFINLEDIDVYVQPQPFVRQVTFNMRANGWLPFRLKEVRQAFMMALNKQQFSQNVFRGYAKPAFTMQPTWSKWYDGSLVPTFGTGDLYSPGDALQQMQDAISGSNYDYTYDGDTLVDGNGDQVRLSLMAQAGQPTEQTMAEVMAQAFRQLGVEIQIDTVEGVTFQTNYAINSVPEDMQDQVPEDWPSSPFNAGPRDIATSKESWDLGLIFEFNTYPRTPSDSDVFMFERGSVNYYGYVPSEGVDIKAKYDEASKTVDDAERQALFAEAFGLIAEEQPFGFLVMEDDIAGFRDGIFGPVEKFGSGWNWQTYFRQS